MASFEKRPKNQQETLMFDNPEMAAAFQEGVGEKLQQQEGAVTDKRQVMADAVAEEFSAQGQSVTTDLARPWQHTPQEHAEVQHLADVAFARNLKTALAQARGSDHYPRNIDLLHDVLTGEMYEALVKNRVNKQPLLGWFILTIIMIILASLVLAVSLGLL